MCSIVATLSVEGESGLVRGEASVPERLAAVAQAAARRHEPWHGAWAWPRRLRESDQAFSIINTKSTRKSRQKSPKSDVSACFGGGAGGISVCGAKLRTARGRVTCSVGVSSL